MDGRDCKVRFSQGAASLCKCAMQSKKLSVRSRGSGPWVKLTPSAPHSGSHRVRLVLSPSRTGRPALDTKVSAYIKFFSPCCNFRKSSGVT